jgi:hypothetical protein
MWFSEYMKCVIKVAFETRSGVERVNIFCDYIGADESMGEFGDIYI